MKAVILKKMNVSYEIAEYAEEFYASGYSEIIKLLNSYYIEELKESKENIRIGFGIHAKNENDELVGGLVGFSELKWLYIDSLYVFGEYRNKGIASSLLEKAEQIARERECFGLKSECYENTINFYRKKGYCDYYTEKTPNSHDVYYVKKML